MINSSNSVISEKAERVYCPQLDGLRFFAFILVFIHHHSFFGEIQNLTFLKSYGWIGVDLFFVLSAFLFTKLLIAEHNETKTISIKKFYIRRIFRIWPLYYVFLAVITCYYLLNNDFEMSRELAIRIFGLLTFSDNILTAIQGYNPLIGTGHLWTISYEEQFYVFIPIIILLLVEASRKTRIISLVTSLVVLSAVRFWFIYEEISHPAIWVLPITHFESIILGIVIGFGGLDFLLNKIGPLLMGLISVCLFIILYQLPLLKDISFWLYASYALIGLSTAFVLLAVLNSKTLSDFFSKSLFVFLGKRSYGLYVYHLVCISMSDMVISKLLEGPMKHGVSFILALISTIVVSVISYYFIETPFLRLKKKFEVVASRPI